VWDWSLDVEGSLALDRSEDWLELVANSGHRPSRARLKAAPASATVA